MQASNVVDRHFGTVRGFVRLALSYAQVLVVPKPDFAKVQRLVFVCHGNICRSAFADVLAGDLDLETASFGLSTTTGLPAHPPVTRVAREMGVRLSDHLTMAADDFSPRSGDLFLVMEIRQLARLRQDHRFNGLQIDVLGRYAGVPHLHDPYQLNDDYVRICLKRIDRAVRELASRLQDAKALQ